MAMRLRTQTMPCRRILVFILLAGALLMAPPVCEGNGQEGDGFDRNIRARLWAPGYKRVALLVEHLNQGAREIGLSQDAIETCLAMRLKPAGIQTITSDPGKYEANNQLYLIASIVGDVFNVGIEFWREPSIQPYGRSNDIWLPSSWEQNYTGYHGGNPDSVMKAILDAVDLFLENYLRANTETVGPETPGLTDTVDRTDGRHSISAEAGRVPVADAEIGAEPAISQSSKNPREEPSALQRMVRWLSESHIEITSHSDPLDVGRRKEEAPVQGREVQRIDAQDLLPLPTLSSRSDSGI